MKTLTTTRRARGRRIDCPLAAPRKQSHRTLRTGSVKGTRELAAHHDELFRQLDSLHAEGIWTGPQHAALCEAVSAVQLGLRSVWQAIEPRHEKSLTGAVYSRANKRQRSAEARSVA